MDATEARNIAEQNGHKIANTQLKNAIQEMQKEIEQSATAGRFEAKITILPSTPWEQHSNSEKLEQHFAERGFVVETLECNLSISISCRW